MLTLPSHLTSCARTPYNTLAQVFPLQRNALDFAAWCNSVDPAAVRDALTRKRECRSYAERWAFYQQCMEASKPSADHRAAWHRHYQHQAGAHAPPLHPHAAAAAQRLSDGPGVGWEAQAADWAPAPAPWPPPQAPPPGSDHGGHGGWPPPHAALPPPEMQWFEAQQAELGSWRPQALPKGLGRVPPAMRPFPALVPQPPVPPGHHRHGAAGWPVLAPWAAGMAPPPPPPHEQPQQQLQRQGHGGGQAAAAARAAGPQPDGPGDGGGGGEAGAGLARCAGRCVRAAPACMLRSRRREGRVIRTVAGLRPR